jgi:hypothetical protein
VGIDGLADDVEDLQQDISICCEAFWAEISNSKSFSIHSQLLEDSLNLAILKFFLTFMESFFIKSAILFCHNDGYNVIIL